MYTTLSEVRRILIHTQTMRSTNGLIAIAEYGTYKQDWKMSMNRKTTEESPEIWRTVKAKQHDGIVRQGHRNMDIGETVGQNRESLHCCIVGFWTNF